MKIEVAVLNKPTVSVDVKQRFNQPAFYSSIFCMACFVATLSFTISTSSGTSDFTVN